MPRFIANARMYAVSPAAEAAWQDLLAQVCAEAGVAFDYMPYPAPQDLERLWNRPDLGAVFMCGYPIAMQKAPVVPIAAPVPSLPWANGKAVYRTDFVVRADRPYTTLPDTFGSRFGWTVSHSHSGFNAPRHHLLRYRTTERPILFGDVIGNVVTARGILDEVVAGDIDVGPLDAYWHALLRHHRPELTKDIRVIESTDLAPMPAFVASPALDPAVLLKLKAGFVTARAKPWFPPLADALLIEGFADVTLADFAKTLAWDAEAKAALYPEPA